VRGLPNYLSIKTIVAYFEKMGTVSTNPKGDKNVHLFKDKDGAFNGCCNIIFVGSRSARDAVLKLDEKEYKKTGCLIKVSIGRDFRGRPQKVCETDWSCKNCTEKGLEAINFYWQDNCYFCQQRKSPVVEVLGSQMVLKKDDPSQNNVDVKANDSGFESYIQIDQDGSETTKKKLGRRSQDAHVIKNMQEELADELSNYFLNYKLLEGLFPLKVVIKVSRNEETESKPLEKPVSVDLQLNDDFKVVDLQALYESKIVKIEKTQNEIKEEFLVKPEKEEVSAQPPTNKNEGNVLRNPFSDSSESSFDEAEELSVVKKPPIKSNNDNARQDSSDSSDDETPLVKNPIFNKDKVHQISSSESSDDEGSVDSVDSDIQRYIEAASPEPVAKGTKRKSTPESSMATSKVPRADLNAASTSTSTTSSSSTAATGNSDTSRKAFSLDQDKEILQKVIEVLPGKSMASLELPDDVLHTLSTSIKRTSVSISNRWKFSLRVWLVEYYSKNTKSWKKFTKGASIKRREDVTSFFNQLVVKHNVAVDVLMLQQKSEKI